MKVLSALLGLLLFGCGPPLLTHPRTQFLAQNPPDIPLKQWFRIIVLDIGQGDATLLISPEEEVALIDTGPPQRGDQAVLSVLDDQNIKEIKTIFISHYHEDHFGGLEALQKNQHAVNATLIDKNNAHVGTALKLGSVTIYIEAANGQVGEENALSLALLIEYGQFRYFTDGDLPGGGGDPPYQTIDLETPLAPLVGDVDIILVPHHGSHTSTNENFLKYLKPEVAIISLGNENDFYHPHPSVIRRLKEAGIKIYTTERGSLTNENGIEIVNDHICIVTDGETYLVKPYSVDKCSPPPLQ